MRTASCVFLLSILLGCPTTEPDPDPTPAEPTPAVGEGVFASGCPEEGQSLARVITEDAMLPGKAAVGTAGDVLIANEHAAYVVTDTEGQSTYWYYGGVLADAAPMDGCTPGEDKLDELGFVFVVPDIFEFEQSTLRAFRADTVEVVNDGSNGEAAVVRARGSDAIHWLVEHTLIKEAANSGGRPFSEPYGAQILLEYVLEPDSPVLRIDIAVRNEGDTAFQLADAALFQWGETLSQYTFSSDDVSVAGLNLDAGLPWLLASDNDTSYAFGIEASNLATVQFSGVRVAVDLAGLVGGFALAPGESQLLSRYFAVGAGDGGEVIEPLLQRVPEPIEDQTATPGVVSGQLLGSDGPTGGTIEVLAEGPNGFSPLYTAVVGDDGAFEVVVPDFATAWTFGLRAGGPGRDSADVVPVNVGDTVDLALEPAGSLAYAISNDGVAAPGKLVLRRQGGGSATFYLVGDGVVPLPPGTWDWTVTRGYEYGSVTGTVEIPEGGEASLSADLPLVLDTTGWISVDTHVHSSDSPDSDVPQDIRLQQGAAQGLDVIIHTEHENIVDRSTVPAEAGVADWVTNVIGEEVTSVAVEHMTMFPAVPDGSPRGGYVEWYGLDMEELFEAMRTRSDGGVNLLNHPGWMNDIGWDRLTASPTTDPTLLGFTADDALWSWDFDGLEVMNGHGNIFNDGSRRFDNWMSMLNAGHKKIAVGCSDAHGNGGVGFPRTYVTAPSDVPAELDVAALTASFRGGNATVSAGAFITGSIDGAGPGEQITDTDGEVTLDVRIDALPEIDVTHYVVFVNCDMAASVLATAPEAVTKVDGSVPLTISGDSHVVVAAFGSNALPDGLPQYNATRAPRAILNPIYVDADGDGAFSAPGGRECSYDLDVSAAR